jgi:hypothetical protein
LAKITENAILRRMAACIVSFVDLDGIRHSVEVEAEGLYENKYQIRLSEATLWRASLPAAHSRGS